MLSAADRAWIEESARSQGFHLAGVSEVSGPQAGLAERRFSEWVAAGHAGEMDYLKHTDEAGDLMRGDLRRALPWARSVVVCAVNYSTPGAPLSTDPAPPGSGWIARYACLGKTGKQTGNRKTGQLEAGPQTSSPAQLQAADYHGLLLTQLRKLDAQLQDRFPGLRSRCYVDTGPILERDCAARAGIGWIGKNTCLLNQQQGSWLLLGVIVTSLELAPAAASLPAADRCGTCTRCIDACPTQALLGSADPAAPRQMDASLCIAYLTIEKKGSIPEELRAPMGRQVFGCDICQDVCPWNAKAARNTGPIASAAWPARAELINPTLAWLASLEGTEFARVFRGSPVEPTRREATRRKRFRRNLAIAMGNSGRSEFLPQLDAWAAGEDPVLAETAAWAAARLRSAST